MLASKDIGLTEFACGDGTIASNTGTLRKNSVRSQAHHLQISMKLDIWIGIHHSCTRRVASQRKAVRLQ
jgi:hypothetical protein